MTRYPDDPRHVTGDFVVAYIAWTAGVILTQDQLRQWAVRGHIRRIGHNQQGRNVYDLDSVLRHISKRQMV